MRLSYQSVFPFQLLAAAIAEHIRMIRRLRQDFGIGARDMWCFDEIRVYASSQNLNTMTLELASVRDPLVRKIQNPREAYTGIVMASADGENLVFVLVTTKALPQGSVVHSITMTNENGTPKRRKLSSNPSLSTSPQSTESPYAKYPPATKPGVEAL